MSQTIIVNLIKNTKNPLVKQLELRTVIQKPVTANPVAFFLQGIPNVAPSTEIRVFYQSVSTEFIAKHGIEVGSDFGAKTGFPQATLVIKEVFTPNTWTNADGSTGSQKPKINPSTGEVLTSGGRAIYRNVELSLDGKGVDEYIQHTPTSAGVQAPASLLSKATPLVVADEPTLPA